MAALRYTNLLRVLERSAKLSLRSYHSYQLVSSSIDEARVVSYLHFQLLFTQNQGQVVHSSLEQISVTSVCIPTGRKGEEGIDQHGALGKEKKLAEGGELNILREVLDSDWTQWKSSEA